MRISFEMKATDLKWGMQPGITLPERRQGLGAAIRYEALG
jgi:hypothetical protein